MLIYKILRPAEWDALDEAGTTLGAPVDLADGFIHFSTAEQVRETAARHFSDDGDLVLAAVDTESLGQTLKWEASRGGALFPHLFRALDRAEVVWTTPLPRMADGHAFPEPLGGVPA